MDTGKPAGEIDRDGVTAPPGTAMSFGPVRQVNARVLNVGYVEGRP